MLDKTRICMFMVCVVDPARFDHWPAEEKASASKLEYPGRVRLLLEHIGAC